MTKSNKGIFSNQGDVTPRLTIWSSQLWNLSEISSMSPLHASVRNLSDQNWMTYADDKVKQRLISNQQLNSKINDRTWPVFELVRDLIHIHLICMFQEHLIKTEGAMVMKKTFSHCKSMELCGCHSNQGLHWISMKSLCHPSRTRGMLQMRIITKISQQTVEI